MAWLPKAILGILFLCWRPPSKQTYRPTRLVLGNITRAPYMVNGTDMRERAVLSRSLRISHRVQCLKALSRLLKKRHTDPLPQIVPAAQHATSMKTTSAHLDHTDPMLTPNDHDSQSKSKPKSAALKAQSSGTPPGSWGRSS
jgi:hypothetical protein